MTTADSAAAKIGDVVRQAITYISSLPVGLKRFARAVRGHWGVENSCHWTLDTTFREDTSRIQDQ